MRTPRRRIRLARLKKTRRKVHQRFRQRIFERDRQAELAAHPLPRIVVLTGAGISAESGIRTFRAADGLWEEHRVEDVATPEGFRRDPALVQRFYNARRQQLQQPEISPMPRIWRWQNWNRCWATTFSLSRKISITCTSARATAVCCICTANC